MKIGYRTFKTSFAVVLSLLIANLIQSNSPLFAAVAALITMQVTVSESYRIGKERMLGTILGAILGFSYIFINISNILLIGLFVILIILICNKLNWNKSIVVTAIVFLYISIHHTTGSIIEYVLARLLDTFIGISTGVIINYLIHPFNIRKKIFDYSNTLTNSIMDIVKDAIFKNKEFDIKHIKGKLDSLEKDFSIIKEELSITKASKKDNSSIEDLLSLFKVIFIHLQMLALFKNTHSINKENIDILNEFTTIKLTEKNTPPNEECVVSNYHLNKLLTLLFKAKMPFVEK